MELDVLFGVSGRQFEFVCKSRERVIERCCPVCTNPVDCQHEDPGRGGGTSLTVQCTQENRARLSVCGLHETKRCVTLPRHNPTIRFLGTILNGYLTGMKGARGRMS
ncbi:hypothetical protein AMATHDRAFT_71188 [Amanita thiersii Skay4041]|uniref:Uncharacterized protein n=1 Tax=Amanita thiersii Skay4041 TaxID=703135 RepID=A0A2A9N7W4_9AGAR|nr:hypothetical protein AMATHDRAFT_71188 [Amanita thiersii Skay4041]